MAESRNLNYSVVLAPCGGIAVTRPHSRALFVSARPGSPLLDIVLVHEGGKTDVPGTYLAGAHAGPALLRHPSEATTETASRRGLHPSEPRPQGIVSAQPGGKPGTYP